MYLWPNFSRWRFVPWNIQCNSQLVPSLQFSLFFPTWFLKTISANSFGNPKAHQKQMPLHGLCGIRSIPLICSKQGGFTRLSLEWCVMYKGGRESVDHDFLYFLQPLALLCRLLGLARIDWVPPKRVEEMLILSCKCFVRLYWRRIFWCIASLILIWSIWWKRNARIF